MPRRNLLALLAALLAVGCAPTFHAPAADQAQVAAEASRLASLSAAASGEVPRAKLKPADLERAFARVRAAAVPLCRQEQVSCAVTLHLRRSSAINAAMDEGRTLTVTTGLLKAMETEDELAFVLGHEFGHRIADHLGEARARETAGMMVGGLLGTLALAAGAYANPDTGSFYIRPATRDVSNLMSIGADAGRRMFSQSQEIEADYIGYLILRSARYDPNAAIGTFEAMSKATLGEEIDTAFFGSHPGFAERAARLRAALARDQPTPAAPTPAAGDAPAPR